jgi:uncharacterized protein (DUF2141 family)
MERLSLFLLVSFWLFMASMAVTAVWLVEPARAESPAVTARGTAELTIRVEEVSPRGGILRLGLYDAAQYSNEKANPVAAADVPATPGVVTVTLKNLPPGRYAIESYQDVNGNGRMDTSWIGIPEEPYGFSRDAKPFLSKPGFAAVAFTLWPGQNSESFHLQNSQHVANAGF